MKTIYFQLLLVMQLFSSPLLAQWEISNVDTQIYAYLDVSYPDDHTAYVLTQQNGDYVLYKSTNHGISWNRVFTYGLGFFSNKNIQFQNADTGIIVTTFMSYLTTNGGSTWDTLSIDQFQYDADIQLIDNRLYYSYANADSNFVLRSDDLGKHWQYIIAEPHSGSFQHSSICYKLGFWGKDKGIVLSNENTDRLLRTIDGGQTWDTILDFTGAVSSLTRLYAIDSLHYFLTNQDGSTYNTRTAQFPNSHVNLDGLGVLYPLDLAFNNYSDIYACTYYGKVFHSTNEGQSWDTLSTINDNVLSNIAISPNGKIMIAGSKNLYIQDQQDPNSINDDEPTKLIVFPNPSSETIHVHYPFHMQPTKVELINTIGQRIHIDSNHWRQIDVSQLANGIYTLYIRAGEQLIQHKIIVQH